MSIYEGLRGRIFRHLALAAAEEARGIAYFEEYAIEAVPLKVVEEVFPKIIRDYFAWTHYDYAVPAVEMRYGVAEVRFARDKFKVVFPDNFEDPARIED